MSNHEKWAGEVVAAWRMCPIKYGKKSGYYISSAQVRTISKTMTAEQVDDSYQAIELDSAIKKGYILLHKSRHGKIEFNKWVAENVPYAERKEIKRYLRLAKFFEDEETGMLDAGACYLVADAKDNVSFARARLRNEVVNRKKMKKIMNGDYVEKDKQVDNDDDDE